MAGSTGSPSAAATACWVCGGDAAPDPDYSAAELYRCRSCGFLFAARRREEDLKALYDDEYFEEYSRGSYGADEAQRRYEARLRVELVRRWVTAGEMLEVGSAGGYFLAEAGAAGFQAVGVEPGANVADQSRAHLGVDVKTGTLDEVELADHSFDVACAWHVLEHLAEPRAALERILRVLWPGGHLLMEVPNVGSVRAIRAKVRWLYLDLRHHVGHYAPATASRLLESTGFQVLATETFPMLGYLRPALALQPAHVAMWTRDAIDLRTNPRGSHPSKHELLRVVARVPA
jgi:SAM-dependent methyltransferase